MFNDKHQSDPCVSRVSGPDVEGWTQVTTVLWMPFFPHRKCPFAFTHMWTCIEQPFVSSSEVGGRTFCQWSLVVFFPYEKSGHWNNLYK